jgi:hypothetical protein
LPALSASLMPHSVRLQHLFMTDHGQIGFSQEELVRKTGG